MRQRKVSVDLDAAKEPVLRFSICRKLQLRHADYCEPAMGGDIARRKTKSFVHVCLSLRPAPDNILGEADLSVRLSQIAVQYQRSLALCDALSCAVSTN